MHGCSIDGLGDGVGDVFCCADDLECAAAIYLTQSRKAPLSRCESTLYADGNATVAMMTKLLAEQKRKPTCYKKAAEGFLLNHNETRGGFGYNNKNPTGLSGVGALCMQLLGEWNHPAVKRTMEMLESCTFSFEEWEKQPYGGISPLYYWYYITQAKFQEGGATFKKWNEQFLPELVKRQVRQSAEESGYVDHNGKPRETGYWDSPAAKEYHTGGGPTDTCIRYKGGKVDTENTTTSEGARIQDTTLCALQLMVYYRFLPATLAVNVEAHEPVQEQPREEEVSVRATRRRR